MQFRTKFFALFPASVIGIAGLYNFLKLPKQDPSAVKRILFYEKKPRIFGHRAGGHEAPENTLIAIETAFQNGATAVEVDLEFTSDGVPVLFHDDDVDRVTNGTGILNKMTFQDVNKLNAAHNHKYVITKDGKKEHLFEKIPTLAEAVELCMKYNVLMDLDIKSNAEATATALQEVNLKYPNAHDYILVTSFHPYIIYKLRKTCPEFQYGLIWRYYFHARTISGVPRYSWYVTPFLDFLDKLMEISMHSFLPEFLGVSSVVLQKDCLSKKYVADFRSRGFEVIAWTVNKPIEKEYLTKNLGIAIVTDTVLDNTDCEEQTN